jgi:hypothetical protein
LACMPEHGTIGGTRRRQQAHVMKRSHHERNRALFFLALLLGIELMFGLAGVGQSDAHVSRTEFSTVECRFISLSRTNGTLTAYFVFSAEESSRISGTCYPSGRCDPYVLGNAYLLAEGQRFDVITDDQGNPLASRLESPYAQYNIGPNRPIHVYATFAAPPAHVRTVNIYLPDVDPFHSITLSETPVAATYALYMALITTGFFLGLVVQAVLASRRIPRRLPAVLKLVRGRIVLAGGFLLAALFCFLYAHSLISLRTFGYFARGLATFILFVVIYVAYRRRAIRPEGALLAAVGILAAIIWSLTVYP